MPKPAFNAFTLAAPTRGGADHAGFESALVTRKKDGSLVLAVWNYAPRKKKAPPKTVTLKFKGAAPAQAMMSVVDPQHGDVRAAYQAMGSPNIRRRRRSKTYERLQELALRKPRAHQRTTQP